MSFDDHIIYLCPGYSQFPLVSVASSISAEKKITTSNNIVFKFWP